MYGRMNHQIGRTMIRVVTIGKELAAQIRVWPPCIYLQFLFILFFYILLFIEGFFFCIIMLFILCFRTLSGMGLKGQLSGDITGLTELHTLWVLNPHIEELYIFFF